MHRTLADRSRTSSSAGGHSARDAGITMVVVLVCFTLALLVVLGSLAYLTASTVFAA